MKKIIIISTILLLALSSCKESDKLMYDSNLSSISLKLPIEDTTVILRRDTFVYSFAFEKPELKQKTINIPVQIAGYRIDKNRTFNVGIITNATTAVQGVDYEPLQASYTVKAKTGTAYIPLKVNRSNNLMKVAKTIAIELKPSADFELGIKDNQKILISVSDILEEPEWWEGWKYFFGDYHRIKFQEWIKIKGGKGELNVEDRNPLFLCFYYPKECMQIMELRLYFEKNPRYTLEHLKDPNNKGERIVVPCPI